jgi:hypothetical protein
VQAESNNGQGARQQTESSHEQSPIGARSLEREILPCDSVDLFRRDVGGAE